MFKKKLDDPPRVMTMQEIQEDLETFSKVDIHVNRSEIISDLKSEVDFGNINLNQFWDVLAVNKSQIEQMEKMKALLRDVKSDLTERQEDLQQRKSGLQTEIEENLKRLRELKTPK